jgi:hypothetical protein
MIAKNEEVLRPKLKGKLSCKKKLVMPQQPARKKKPVMPQQPAYM